MTDNRFDFQSDARFKKLSDREGGRVKIDKRFSRILKKKSGKSKNGAASKAVKVAKSAASTAADAPDSADEAEEARAAPQPAARRRRRVDKYGRNIVDEDSDGGEAERLRKLYYTGKGEKRAKKSKSAASDDESGSDARKGSSSDGSESGSDSEAAVEAPSGDDSVQIRAASEEDEGSSSDWSDSSSDSDAERDGAGDGKLYEDEDSCERVDDGGDPSKMTGSALAILNCDWGSVSAEDVFAVIWSFCGSGSKSSKKGSAAASTSPIKSVSIYQSDFGAEMMAKEAKHGPQYDVNEKTGETKGESIRK